MKYGGVNGMSYLKVLEQPHYLEDSENMRLSQVAFAGTCGQVEPLHWPSQQAFCLCPQLEKAFKAVALIFSEIAAVSKF